MKKNEIYRQGDILIEKVDNIPNNAMKKDMVLAYGGVTGHKHLVKGQATVLLDQEDQFIDVRQEAEVVHEEHETIKLPVGKYRVVQQREHDAVEGTRKVLD